MQLSKHPQPALLFLVPGVLISLWGTAFVKGDIHTMWNFSDEVEDEDDTEDESNDKTESSDGLPGAGFLGKALGPDWANWIMGKATKSLSASKDGNPSSEESEVKCSESDKTKDNGSNKEKKPRSPSELISILISLPMEPEPEAEDPVGEDDKPVSGPQSSASSSPILVSKDEGPPLKKRRGYGTAS
ncbi:hypothetical protein FQN49_005341 [Arthroderma sp. PD_2]|nr:hypothetical protein FQN49_005341 [Arthroderma sp. PD_2]